MWLSIIIPVYNVSRYIAECVDSLVNQDVGDVEVIMVDDGSTDDSAAICRALAAKHAECHFVEQLHAGVSAARNNGLRKATGDFILFVDGDDFLSPGALAEIYDRVSSRDVDILFASMNDYDNDTGTTSYNQLRWPSDESFRNASSSEVLSNLFSLNDGALWHIRHVFRRTFLLEKDIFFDPDLACSEDCHFFMQAVQAATAFDYSTFPVYNYRRGRSGSTITTMGKKSLTDKMQIADYWCNQILHDNSFSKSMKADIIPAFAMEMMNALPYILRFDDAKTSEAYRLIIKNKQFMKYLPDRKKRIKWAVYRLFGFGLGQSILNRYTEAASLFPGKPATSANKDR